MIAQCAQRFRTRWRMTRPILPWNISGLWCSQPGESCPGRNRHKTRQQGVLDEVLAAPVPPDPEPLNYMLHVVVWLPDLKVSLAGSLENRC